MVARSKVVLCVLPIVSSLDIQPHGAHKLSSTAHEPQRCPQWPDASAENGSCVEYEGKNYKCFGPWAKYCQNVLPAYAPNSNGGGQCWKECSDDDDCPRVFSGTERTFVAVVVYPVKDGLASVRESTWTPRDNNKLSKFDPIWNQLEDAEKKFSYSRVCAVNMTTGTVMFPTNPKNLTANLTTVMIPSVNNLTNRTKPINRTNPINRTKGKSQNARLHSLNNLTNLTSLTNVSNTSSTMHFKLDSDEAEKRAEADWRMKIACNHFYQEKKKSRRNHH